MPDSTRPKKQASTATTADSPDRLHAPISHAPEFIRFEDEDPKRFIFKNLVHCPQHDDLTLQGELARLPKQLISRLSGESIAETVIIEDEEAGAKIRCGGRALICKCKFGKADYFSMTIRLGKLSPGFKKPGTSAADVNNRWSDLQRDKKKHAIWGKWWDQKKRADPMPPFLITFEEQADYLATCIVGEATKIYRHGLLIICANTAAGKSNVVRALMSQLLPHYKKEGRWPHIVTLEDPIEAPLFERPERAWECGLNYTAREQEFHANAKGEKERYPSLEAAVDDALRQTPAIFYLGELRKDGDWKEALRLAGTGHLVVTTAHASGVTECMSRIFAAVNCHSASHRSEIATKLCAIIHLASVEAALDGTGSLVDASKHPERIHRSPRAAMPAIWRASPKGINDLIADGLSSILPSVPNEGLEKNTVLAGSIGRQAFYKRYCNEMKTRLRISDRVKAAAAMNYLERKVAELDEKGL